jgi:hypothetical protein
LADAIKAGDLACQKCWLTVARQRRTYTGFAVNVLTIRGAGHLVACSLNGVRVSQGLEGVKKSKNKDGLSTFVIPNAPLDVMGTVLVWRVRNLGFDQSMRHMWPRFLASLLRN